MTSIQGFHRAAILALAASLATACGGGGGGGGGGGDAEEPPPEVIPTAPSTPIDLSSKTHVLREVGNTLDVYAAFFNLESPGSAASIEPKAAVPEPCPRSGTRTTEEGSGTRAFAFFDVSDSVTFTTEDNDACAEDGPGADGTYTTYDGRLEQGETAPSPEGDSHGYDRYGSDQDRYSQIRRDDAAPGDFDYRDARGLTEFFLPATQTQSRAVLETRYERREGSSYTAGTFFHGAQGDPFVTTFDVASDTLRFDGPYRYATRTCAGGQARVATLQPVTFDDAGVPESGQLEFSNGTSAVRVTFDGGTASFQFVGGSGGTLTRDEIVASAGLC